MGKIAEADAVKCPQCGVQLESIDADSSYDIYWSEESDQWVKTEGVVLYHCRNCKALLQLSEISSILAQVDEL